MMIKFSGKLLTCLGVLLASPVGAATFNYDMVVTQSNDAAAQAIFPEFDLPDVGSLGTVSIDIDGAGLDGDGDPATGVNGPAILDTALTGASASFGGLFSEITEPTWFGFAGIARLSNTDFASISIDLVGADCPALDCTLAGSFTVENAAYTPTTFTDIEAMLGDPNSDIFFSFSGTVGSGLSVSFQAERAVPPEVVPLPASALLLLCGLGVGRLMLRRKTG